MKNYLLSRFVWRGIRLKGIWRRARERHKDTRDPPRHLTLRERLAATEPEIKAGKETA